MRLRGRAEAVAGGPHPRIGSSTSLYSLESCHLPLTARIQGDGDRAPPPNHHETGLGQDGRCRRSRYRARAIARHVAMKWRGWTALGRVIWPGGTRGARGGGNASMSSPRFWRRWGFASPMLPGSHVAHDAIRRACATRLARRARPAVASIAAVCRQRRRAKYTGSTLQV